MAGKPVRSALTEILADLSPQNLKMFCRELTDPNQVPRITRNKVDGKDNMDIADVVVSTFTEKNAVGKAAEILRRINCSNEADRLVKETSGQTSQPAPTDAQEAGGQTDDVHFVDKHKVALIRRVSNITSILDDLVDKDVISQEAYDRIRKMATSQEKMRELYAGPLKAGVKCKDIFCKILEEHEKYLIEDLKG